MSELRAVRARLVRFALEDCDSDLDRAAKQAEKEYRKHVCREVTFGEYQDIAELTDKIHADMIAERKQKTQADAEAYRNRK